MCCGGNIFEATLSTLRKRGFGRGTGRERVKEAGQEQDIDGSIAVVIRRLLLVKGTTNTGSRLLFLSSEAKSKITEKLREDFGISNHLPIF